MNRSGHGFSLPVVGRCTRYSGVNTGRLKPCPRYWASSPGPHPAFVRRPFLTDLLPMKNTTEMFLSRNFVEFGPFTPDEMSAFAGRGLLLETDYVKEAGGHVWQPYMEWAASLAEPKPGKVTAKKPAVRKPKSKPKSKE